MAANDMDGMLFIVTGQYKNIAKDCCILYVDLLQAQLCDHCRSPLNIQTHPNFMFCIQKY